MPSTQKLLITQVAALAAVLPEWKLLWQRCPAATPFQHPAWLLPWWDAFGSGELFSFAVHLEGRLVALAPMFLHPWNGKRQVTFLGNGPSDHLDFLVEPGAPATAPILDAVALACRRWDLCDLQDLAPDAALAQAAIPATLQWSRAPQYTCSSISLPDTVEAFQAALPHGLKRNLRRYRTHMEEHGPVTLESATPQTFPEILDALFVLHRSRRAMKDDEGMLQSGITEQFHRRAAQGLNDVGLVRLHALRFQNRIAAVVYAFVSRGRAYSYQGGFDPALAKFSPGALILQYAIEQAIREDVTEFDFLRGDESYKADWGARPYTANRLLLWPA